MQELLHTLKAWAVTSSSEDCYTALHCEAPPYTQRPVWVMMCCCI